MRWSLSLNLMQMKYFSPIERGGAGGGSSEPPESKLDPPLLIETSMYTYANAQTYLAASYMNMQLICTSKNIWAELSYEFGPSCLIDSGRVGMGRVLCGPSWHGPS